MTVTGQHFGGRHLSPFTNPDPGLTPNWRDRAACRDVDTEVFFVHPNSDDDVAWAKAWCRTCPVRADCLAWALAAGAEYGIWGGTTPTERKATRKTRGAA